MNMSNKREKMEGCGKTPVMWKMETGKRNLPTLKCHLPHKNNSSSNNSSFLCFWALQMFLGSNLGVR